MSNKSSSSLMAVANLLELVFILTTCLFHGCIAENYNARAWQGVGAFDYVWPENDSANLADRADVGLCFSGGATRAFTSALGEVRALEDLGLMSKAKYVASVSGGSWFMTLFYYYQSGAVNDADLLCPYADPTDLTMESLSVTPGGCALAAAANTSLYASLAKNLLKTQEIPRYDPGRVWPDSVAEVFYKPWGLDDSTKDFSWNESTVEAILERNPGMSSYMKSNDNGGKGGGGASQFILPRSSERPFPIFVGTIDGPASVSGDEAWKGGLAPCNRTFTQLQMTPLYVGKPLVEDVSYFLSCNASSSSSSSSSSSLLTTAAAAASNVEAVDGDATDPRTTRSTSTGIDSSCVEATAVVRQGGFVEPFAFGGSKAPSQGLAANETEGILSVPEPKTPFTVALAGGVSSMAPSSSFSEPAKPTPPLPDPDWERLKNLEIVLNMWPVSSSSSEPVTAAVSGTAESESVVGSAQEAKGVAAKATTEGNPTTAPSIMATVTPMVVGDGGNLDNVGVFAMLQRKVGNIVLFCNTEAQLAPVENWDPTTQAPVYGQVDGFLAALFGYQVWGCDTESSFSNSVQFTQRNQVFASSDFGELASALQTAQASSGSGAAATALNLVTVENKAMGVAGGHSMNLTVVYLSEAQEWRAQLDAEIQEQLDLGAQGAFPNFPFYSTFYQLELSAAQGNLLADMTSWQVRRHAEPNGQIARAFERGQQARNRAIGA